jgi:histidine triad (HIT) family protein
MAYEYDDANVFARILRGEIPNRTVLETEHTLAFHDIRAQAPVDVWAEAKDQSAARSSLRASRPKRETTSWGQAARISHMRAKAIDR